MASRYYSGPVSDHFDGETFFLPGQPTVKRSRRDLLRWRLSGGRRPWPEKYPSPFAGARPPPRVAGLRATLIGHASFLLQLTGLNLLVDPVWSRRASPFRVAGPRRVNPPGVAFADLPQIDAVLLTHNHYDHMDLRTLGRLWRKFRPHILMPLGNDAILRRYYRDASVEVLDWGESAPLGAGVTATLEPAQHWSARRLTDRRMALWGAWVLTTPRGVVYHVGDSGYGDGSLFHAVRARHGPPRLAILPIGAYEPRWFMQPMHMNPAESVQAFLDCGAAQALGHHWGTFQLTDEGIEQPAEDLRRALEAAGIPSARFRALHPGEAWDADQMPGQGAR